MSFDAQLVRPAKSIEKLQDQYVRLRIVNMAEVDTALFEFDFDLTLAVFVLNHERQVYLRYGGRTDVSAEAYLSNASLESALARGLELHAEWKAGKLKLPPAPEPVPAQTYPNVLKVAKKGECVHCHQLADGVAQKAIAGRGFNKKTDPWVYPNPVRLGLVLDPGKGNVLKSAKGAAREAGLKTGDRITRVDGRLVSTFGDLQYALHKVGPGKRSIEVVTQDGSKELALPDYWRVTDINRRAIGHRMAPFPEFWAQALAADEKSRLGFHPDSFASRVTKFWGKTNGSRAGLREGDIVTAVNGVKSSPLAQNVMIYIRTHFGTGDEITVAYRRGDESGTARFKLRAKPW